MPSPVNSQLHAAFETKQHETLLRIEWVVDQISARIRDSASSAVSSAAENDLFGQSQRRTAEILRGIVPGIAEELDKLFRRLNWWSYNETVAILARQIPRRWFRRAIPQAVLVGEADGLPIAGTDLWADTLTEPVVGKRLSDSEWQQFLKNHLFPPPSKEAVDAVIYDPVAGMNWQQRLDVLSHKITDMDKLAGMLSTGASSGMSQAELKRQIQPLVQNIASSAARIARTEGLRIATMTQRNQYAELGDMLAGVQIIATLDENTRPHHSSRHGRIYWTDSRKKPHISELPALPDEPNCRCYDSPVLHPPEEFESDPQLRAEFANAAGNSIPDPQVYSQWFNQADPGRRKMAVGATRYRTLEKKLGRAPEFTDFIGADGRLLTVDQLRRETPRNRELRLQQVSQSMLQRQELLTKASRFGFVSPVDTQRPTSVGSAVQFRMDATDPARQVMRRWKLSPGDVASLCGVRSGSELDVSSSGNALRVTVHHADYVAYRNLRMVHGQLSIENEKIEVNVTGRGIGTEAVIQQCLHAARLNVNKITLEAARSDAYIGYKIWPKMGFNASLPESLRRRLKAIGIEASDFLELMASPDGRAYWEEHGFTVKMSFDLRKDSRSWDVLRAYARQKGLPMEENRYVEEPDVKEEQRQGELENSQEPCELTPFDFDEEAANQALDGIAHKLIIPKKA